ncbi:unnamed protein product [Paramecium sonneborni]|uniref:Transmembrane protein n=1 Tax=Paramecium sonneborni TaxID=65129 RepID=A0A8S1KS65_9CILI|nr:unnamed protein product [Paramecium sonneborni]
MYIVFFSFVYVVYSITYVINKDEIKILENYAIGIEKYDKLKEKLSIYNVGQIDNDEQIIQIISMFMPFDSQQRVDILTKKIDNKYRVYTLYYTKQQSSEYNLKKVELEEENCTSITYYNNEFVVDCTFSQILFVLQNGNKIQYNNTQNLQFTKIFGFYNGLLGLSPGYLTFFNESLYMERQIQINYIQVLKDEKNVYILTELQVIQYTQDGGVILYDHSCQKKPEFMTILGDIFYIQCGTLRKIHNKEIEVFSQKVTQLSATNRYLIINNTSIYNKDFDSNFQVSIGQIYPTNYDDDIIQIVNNKIQIGSIFGYYLIQSDEICQFNLSFNSFYVVDQGLQTLNSGESEFYGNEYKILNYVSGPFIQIQEQGFLNQPYKLNIEKELTNKQLLTLLNYLDESILLIYLQDSQLYSQKCQTNKLHLLCEIEVLLAQNIPQDIRNVQGTVVGNQIIIAYQSQDTLFIYIDNILLQSINKVTTFLLYQNNIIILNQSQVTINYVIDKQLKQETQINITCIMVSMFSNDIALVDQKNNLVIISNSNNGWYQSFIKSFQDKIFNINYINSQLIVLTNKQAFVYENRILRGKLLLDDPIENLNYQSTQTHLYIYNSTNILQFQIYSELSLSSWPQQIIQQKIEQRFLTLTFREHELLLQDNNLYIYSSILEFTPNNIVERDVYSRFIFVDVIFNNYKNQSITVKVKLIGNILKLQPLQFNQTDYKINNGLLQIDQSLFFDGPISSIISDSKDNFQILERVTQSQNQPSWIKYGFNDLIYIGNDQRIVIQNSSLFLFSESKSQQILNDIKNCFTLEQDQLQFYLVCQNFIYAGLKQNPEQIDKFDFDISFNQLISIKFDQGQKIGILNQLDQDTQISIYENYKLKEQKVIDGLKDFQFSDDANLILLISNKVIIVDSQLKEINQFDLLANLIQTEQNSALQFIEFQQICQYKENQYIVSSKDGPIYLIFLNKQYSELVLQFTNIQGTTAIETYLLEKSILICIQKNENNDYFAAFYDFEDKSKSSLIIPYFNVIKLGSPLSFYHYTRQYNNNSIVLNERSGAISVFLINDYLQIKSISQNKKLEELIANDLNFQQTKVNLKIDLSESEQKENRIIVIYILCGVFGIIFLLIAFRYLRRCCLARHLKLIEEKPSQFKSEYI